MGTCARSPRPFAIAAEDLEVDFDAPRPLVITGILRLCCGGPDFPDDAIFWDMAVTRRQELLFEVLERSRPGSLSLTLNCPEPDCGEQMEIEIAREELPVFADGPAEVELAGAICRLRKPTGRDQLAWLTRGYADPAAAVRDVIGALLDENGRQALERHPDAEWRAATGQALEMLDPLMTFELLIACPHCGRTARHAPDLESGILRELRALQNRLLAEVHTLAAAYHWNEQEILAVPAARRRRYLDLLRSSQAI